MAQSKARINKSRVRIPALSQKAEKRIAERAKEIAEENAKKIFNGSPTGRDPRSLTPYRPRPANERYKNSFEVQTSTGKDGTRYFLTNNAQTRKARGRQQPQRNLAAIIEKGSKPHVISPTAGKFLHWMTVTRDGSVSGVWVQQKIRDEEGNVVSRKPASVKHPGTGKGHNIMKKAVAQAVREYREGKLK